MIGNVRNTEAEEYFRQLALDHDAAQSAWQHIITAIDNALGTEDLDALWKLIPYIEEGDGHLAFQYIGKTHRILRILNILRLEHSYHKTLFCQGCDNMDALWEKYMLTLFAFRRILFQLSGESQEEAVIYLQNHPVSHFAAYIMTQNDLIVPDRSFYETLAHIYVQEWSADDMQQFFALTDADPAGKQQENSHERP
ncbi:MAG: hypothetical protein NC305_06920 [Lachnospiraceae bacterium]|nr:hypothetical protein [Butyrivibrio sp.]MCM1342430.1 hypothetical protein [Muribaculaceae bacterium]MCM1410263.1 hypothetical protein [Lachnospiraceae bacterium]